MCAAITSAAIGVAASGAMAIKSASDKKKAKAELNNYERQELINAAENIEISTMGSDLMREESQRLSANIASALQGGGSRGLAMLPQVQSNINQTNRQIQKDLDDQVIQREYAIADEESRIRGIREQRDNQNINALSSQVNAADQNLWNGVSGVVAGAGSLGRSLGDGSASASSQSSQTQVTSLAENLEMQPVQAYNPFSGVTPFSLPAVDKLFTEKSMYKDNNGLV